MTVFTWGKHSGVPTALCSPFIDPLHKFQMTYFSTFLSICVHLTAAVFIVGAQSVMLWSIKQSQKKIQHLVISKVISLKPVIVQVVTITLCIFLCWVPSDLIHTNCLFVEKCPVELFVWNMFAVMPINSIANPVLFSLVSLRKLWKARQGNKPDCVKSDHFFSDSQSEDYT